MLMVIQMIIVRRHCMTKQLRSLILLCISVMFCVPDVSWAELIRCIDSADTEIR